MLHQSPTSKRREHGRDAFVAGCVISQVFTYDFAAAYTAAEVIEMGQLPQSAQILSAEVVGSGLGAATIDVGFVSGEFGENDAAKTCGAELIDDGANANAAATLGTCLGIAPDRTNHRSLGAKLSANVAANAGTLKLMVTYAH